MNVVLKQFWKVKARLNAVPHVISIWKNKFAYAYIYICVDKKLNILFKFSDWGNEL